MAVAAFVGPELSVVVGSICALAVTALLAMRAEHSGKLDKRFHVAVEPHEALTLGGALRAWSCFILIFILLMGTSKLVPFVNSALAPLSSSVQVFSGKNPGTLSFMWVNTPGIWIFLAAIVGGFIQGARPAQMLEVLGKVLEGEGIEFEVCQPGAKVHPCMACYHCLDNGTLRCVQNDDGVNEIIEKCIEADGIVLASPVYHGGIAGGMKCVLDRLILAAGCGENKLHHKVGAALCTLRRSGGMETYQQLLGTINTMEMVLVTSDYWNAVHGADKGEVMQDTEGVEVIEKLGRNIAWMLKVIDKAGIEPPETGHRTMTNFIR